MGYNVVAVSKIWFMERIPLVAIEVKCLSESVILMGGYYILGQPLRVNHTYKWANIF